MFEIADWIFPALTLTALVGVPLYAALQRGRFYAIFSIIILGFSSAGAWAVYGRLGEWLPSSLLPLVQLLFIYGMISMSIHYLMLVLALGSLVLYVGDTVREAGGQSAFVFVVVPLVSWVLMVLVISIAAFTARRRSSGVEQA